MFVAKDDLGFVSLAPYRRANIVSKQRSSLTIWKFIFQIFHFVILNNLFHLLLHYLYSLAHVYFIGIKNGVVCAT